MMPGKSGRRLSATGFLLTLAVSPSGAGHAQSLDDRIGFVSPFPFIDMVPTTARYGPDAACKMTLYLPRKGIARALVAGDPGSLSTETINRLLDDGIAIASVGWRDPRRAGQRAAADDLATAIAWLAREKRMAVPVVLVGSGWNGGIVALVATDPAIAAKAGLPFDRLKGAILFDPTALDGPSEVARRDARYRRPYLRAFGPEPAEQAKNSATGHTDAPNTTAVLFVRQSVAQGHEADADRFAQALRETGTTVDTVVRRPSMAGGMPPMRVLDDRIGAFIRDRLGGP